MPNNNLVELYETRVGIYFEVDPFHTEIKHANVPIDIISLLMNIIFFSAFLMAVGVLFVRQCASRKMSRDLLKKLSLRQDGKEYKLTWKQKLKHDLFGKIDCDNNKDSLSALNDKLDIIKLLTHLDTLYDEYEARNGIQKKPVVVKPEPLPKVEEKAEEESDDFGRQEILYSSVDKKEDDLDISQFSKQGLNNKPDKQMSIASWDIDNYLKQTVSPHPQSLFDADIENQKHKQKQHHEPHSEQYDQNLEETARQMLDLSKASSHNTESVHKLPQLKLKIVGENEDVFGRPQTKQDDASPVSFSMGLKNKNVSPKRQPQNRYLDPTYSSSSRNYQTRFDKTQCSQNNSSKQEPQSASNNLDELNRIYRNNTLWEIGESQNSNVERSPPATRDVKRKSRSPASQRNDGPRASRLYQGSPSLRLNSRIDNRDDFSPQSREAQTIEL